MNIYPFIEAEAQQLPVKRPCEAAGGYPYRLLRMGAAGLIDTGIRRRRTSRNGSPWSTSRASVATARRRVWCKLREQGVACSRKAHRTVDAEGWLTSRPVIDIASRRGLGDGSITCAPPWSPTRCAWRWTHAGHRPG